MPRKMAQGMHKLFLTTCERGERRSVSANECSACPHGSVIDNKTKVLCGGSLKFFSTPCFFDTRASATVRDCEECPHGEVGDDRLRVYCSHV